MKPNRSFLQNRTEPTVFPEIYPKLKNSAHSYINKSFNAQVPGNVVKIPDWHNVSHSRAPRQQAPLSTFSSCDIIHESFVSWQLLVVEYLTSIYCFNDLVFFVCPFSSRASFLHCENIR